MKSVDNTFALYPLADVPECYSCEEPHVPRNGPPATKGRKAGSKKQGARSKRKQKKQKVGKITRAELDLPQDGLREGKRRLGRVRLKNENTQSYDISRNRKNRGAKKREEK